MCDDDSREAVSEPLITTHTHKNDFFFRRARAPAWFSSAFCLDPLPRAAAAAADATRHLVHCRGGPPGACSASTNLPGPTTGPAQGCPAQRQRPPLPRGWVGCSHAAVWPPASPPLVGCQVLPAAPSCLPGSGRSATPAAAAGTPAVGRRYTHGAAQPLSEALRTLCCSMLEGGDPCSSCCGRTCISSAAPCIHPPCAQLFFPSTCLALCAFRSCVWLLHSPILSTKPRKN